LLQGIINIPVLDPNNEFIMSKLYKRIITYPISQETYSCLASSLPEEKRKWYGINEGRRATLTGSYVSANVYNSC